MDWESQPFLYQKHSKLMYVCHRDLDATLTNDNTQMKRTRAKHASSSFYDNKISSQDL